MSGTAGRNLFLFAGLRIQTNNKPYLILIQPKTGKSFQVEEDVLLRKSIPLGSFLMAKPRENGTLGDFTKAEHNAKVTVTVEQDVAYMEDVPVKTVRDGGRVLCQSPIHSDALCRDQQLAFGKYSVRINMMRHPLNRGDRAPIFFEATEAKLIPRERFEPKPISSYKKRAVVISVLENSVSWSHFLWLPDEQAEGRFISQEHHLEKVHFFEGLFKMKKGIWECYQYDEPIESMIEGGLSRQKNVYFRVEVDNYRPANRERRWPVVTAKYFGDVFDVHAKLPANFAGKAAMVRITRHRIDSNPGYIWTIAELD